MFRIVRRRKVIRTYEIITLYADNVPHRKGLMISLEYPDWCEFEKTLLYRDLIEHLEHLEIPNSMSKRP